MKIVLNECYGGFGLSDFGAKILGTHYPEREMFFEQGNAMHETLAALVEAFGTQLNGEFANLQVYEIPDDVTDWEINEYDGYESLLYVRKGKICRA